MLAKKRLSAVSIVLVCALAALAALAGLSLPVSASASDIKYCSDGSYEGEGTPVVTSEYVYWDSYVEHNEYYVFQAPSYGVTDLSIDNYCAPAAGTVPSVRRMHYSRSPSSCTFPISRRHISTKITGCRNERRSDKRSA